MISEEQNIDLAPLMFSLAEIRHALANRKMLALQAHFPAICNYDCYYCYTKHLFSNKELSATEGRFEIYDKFLRQGSQLGAKTISIPGLGEPFLVPWFGDFLASARKNGLGVVVFTNGSLIEKNLELLEKYRPALYVKLNTVSDSKLMDAMCNRTNTWAKAWNGLKELRRLKYHLNGKPLIGIETVVLQENYHEIPELYTWCRENNFVPLVELPMPHYNVKQNAFINKEQQAELFKTLQEIDQKYNFHWNPKAPFAGSSCSFHLFSLCLYPDGTIHPCSGIKLDEPYGNLYDTDLFEIWYSDRVSNKIKKISEMRACDPDGNYGCRAYAFRKTGDMFAPDSRNCC
jgi:MoaA/NifB/PqqE/SkfB family radical SAM enzyme